MRLVTAEVDRYGPLTGCHPPCDDGVTIVAGPNESGKTLYLEALLQLLDPAVAAHMDPSPRVDGAPAGRVVVENGTGRHALGDETVLSDVAPIEPSHLSSVFVVRDGDLVLPDGPDYYAALVDHLGDIHTTEIDAIRAELVDVGRLTPQNLNLRDREYDTKTVVADAEALRADVEDYLATVEDEGLDAVVRERFSLRRDLATVESRLETQRVAKKLVELAEGEAQLAVYEDATSAIRDRAAVDRETLTHLQELDNDRTHAREAVSSHESDLEAQRATAEEFRERLGDARDRHAALEQRETDVAAVEDALDAYRDAEAGIDGETDGGTAARESRLRLRRVAVLGGLAGGGVAAGAGALADSGLALGASILLVSLAIAAGLSHQRLAGRVADADALAQDLLASARDAGFSVDEPAEVAPAVRDYRDELDAAAQRRNELDARLEQAEDRIDELRSEREAAIDRRERYAEEIEAILDDAGVDSIDEYETRLVEREEAASRRDEAAAILATTVGEPPAEAPGGAPEGASAGVPEEQIEYWERQLAARREDLGETDVDAEQYDEAELERLQARRAQRESDLEDCESTLSEFQATLADFDRRANELVAPPFVETAPSLPARTVDGLRALADDLDDLVGEIRSNAEVSRKAVDVLDAIKADEQRKISTLFDPDGPASAAFAHLTDGRYEAVDYDPEAETLSVRTADGATRSPRRLSRGTRDQLYFAARLSLARQLLGGDAGFLLLDDPFLAADPDRLHNGFETLAGLADEGWQIVYLTAKAEVRERMASSFDCAVYELPPLEG